MAGSRCDSGAGGPWLFGRAGDYSDNQARAFPLRGEVWKTPTAAIHGSGIRVLLSEKGSGQSSAGSGVRGCFVAPGRFPDGIFPGMPQTCRLGLGMAAPLAPGVTGALPEEPEFSRGTLCEGRKKIKQKEEYWWN